MKKYIGFLLSVITAITTLTALHADIQWSTDYPKALQQAAGEKKRVLLDFTGSDWCSHCKALDEKVFSQSSFQEFAAKNLILVQIDFPEGKEQSDALKKQNEQLQVQYQITGFPTLVLLDSTGKEIKRSHGDSSPEALIKWIN